MSIPLLVLQWPATMEEPQPEEISAVEEGETWMTSLVRSDNKDRGEIIILKGAYELDQVSRDLRSWPTFAKKWHGHSGTSTKSKRGAIKILLLQTWKAAKPGTWWPSSELQNAKSKQVPVVVLPRTAEYGPCESKYSGWILTSRFLVWLAPSNTSFPLDLYVISSNGSRLLLCWTGASHPATNWLREHQQPSASVVRPFDPPFLPLLDLCVISSPSNTSFPLDLCVISSNRSRLLLSWTGASHPSTNWLREHQQPSASAVRPFDPPFLPLLDLCVISSNN
ncbi:hypothetical protein DY000_02039650 [Brassica cretica]|uniref:Uncharacterized protein n=1 Tax=Brassica cretica TaxID=69181 RepID=A0ABQ7BGB3_BRACR|nr:hypothetical protein DY000_02039650 [Brassica cretica]